MAINLPPMFCTRPTSMGLKFWHSTPTHWRSYTIKFANDELVYDYNMLVKSMFDLVYNEPENGNWGNIYDLK
jgi:hypothetical protein